jgi:ABC-type arginine transport system ATPase subunit
MSLQGGKKWVKMCGEREIVYNVFKFMKTESEVGITIPLSKVQKKVTEATHVCRRTLFRILEEGENVETGVAMAFSTPHKLRTNFALKVS